MELHKIYRPITATPFRKNESYMEFEPCDALKPYIRCFWGTKKVTDQEKSDVIVKEVVTPDTCADLIFTVDFTNNAIESVFAAIGDRTLNWYSVYKENKRIFSFAIRFYAWGVSAFAEESLNHTKNNLLDMGYHFPKIKNEIEKQLFDVTNIDQLIPKVEKVLLKHFSDRHRNQVVLQAISRIVKNKGNLLMADLRKEMFLSERQLERLFGEYVGVSPKGLASMVRYQCLWCEVLCNKNFNGMDAVDRYGYSDYAHLCHDFKKFHSMSMADARKFALQNVGNIQDALA